MAKSKAGRKGAARQRNEEIAGPTIEQMASAAFEVMDVTDKRRGGGAITIGKAWRRRPMIDQLAEQGILSTDEHKALRHYRHHADISDRSTVRDSLNLLRGGSGDGPTITTVHAMRVRDDCERAVGSLIDILRAVVVYDRSLSQWAMDRGGALERRRQRGNRVEVRLEPAAAALSIARMEIRIAAQRVQAELDA